MKKLMSSLLPFALAMTAFAGAAPRDAKDIQGTWVPVKAEIGGEPMKSEFLTNTVMKLDNGKYVVTVAGSPDKGDYTIDAGSKPKTIDINGAEGPNAGKKITGIYELKGNTLKICYGLSGSARPTEFKSPPGTRYFLVTYERRRKSE
jgi:uncharacterized protein (TIGR03067 family)